MQEEHYEKQMTERIWRRVMAATLAVVLAVADVPAGGLGRVFHTSMVAQASIENMSVEEIQTQAAEINMPAFEPDTVVIDGIAVTVSAPPPGVFPDGATLSVKKATVLEQDKVEEAVEAERGVNVNVAASYTFDITVLDADGNELQPTDDNKVKVSFALAEVADENLNTNVYHVSENGQTGGLEAEALNVTQEITEETGEATTATVETAGFSYYTVEFTYDEKQYVMNGDATVALADILDYVGLVGVPAAVSVSDESLFSASDESGEWMVTAHRAFTSTEWMKVTIDGVEYEIVVTDDTGTMNASSVKVGDHVNMGTKPTGVTGTPYWRVLYVDTKNKRALLLSEYTWTGNWSSATTNPQFGSESTDETWSDSTGQSWCTSFYNNVFSASEKNKIIGVNSTETGTITFAQDYYTRWTFDATPFTVSDNTDKVFWLSAMEVATYFGNSSGAADDNRVAYSHNVTGKGEAVLWWTRSGCTGDENGVAAVGNNGAVACPSADHTAIQARPAFWLNLSTDISAPYEADGSNKIWTMPVKTNPTVTAPTAKTLTYNGSDQALVNAGSTTGGTLKYTKGSNATTAPTSGWNTSIPTGKDAGTYYVWYKVDGGDNYFDVSAACITVTIGQAANPLTYTSTQTVTKTFSTSSQTATLAGASNGQGTVSYAISSQKNSSNNAAVDYFTLSGTTLTVAASTPVGTYNVDIRASATGNSNYNSGTKDSTVTVTISNAAMNVSAGNYSGTYDGNAHGITVNVASPAGATIKYRTAASGDYNLTDNPTYTNAGTYTVYYQVTKANYTTVTGSATVTIQKKDVTVSGITAGSKTYDRSTAAALNTTNASFAGKLAGDTLTVSATGTFDNMNAGTGKTVTISGLTLGGASAGNYKIADSGNQTTTTANITAKALTVTAEAKTKVYGTADPALTYTSSGLISGDSFTGTLSRNAGSDVGTYAITQGTLTAGSNYSITYMGAVFTITKATPAVTGLAARELTYDKTEQELITAGTTTGGTLKYAMTVNDAAAPSDDMYTTVIPTAMHAGTYTVYYKVVGNHNYFDVAPASVDVTIAQKEITISGITAEDKIYDKTTDATLVYSRIDWDACGMVAGDNLTINATGTFSDINAAEGKTVTISDYELCGETISEYKLARTGQQATTTATIQQKEVSLEWHIGDTVYDGVENIPTFIFNGKDQKPSAVAKELIAGDTCSVTVSGEKTNVGSSYTATAASLGNTNYKLPTANTIPFKIIPRTIVNGDIAFGHDEGLEVGNYEYTGDVITPEISVSTVLEGDTDATNLVLNNDYVMSRDTTATSTGTHYIKFDGRGNYDGTVYLPWYIVAKTVTVTAEAKTKVYGDEDPEFTVSVVGATADEINYNIERDTAEDADTSENVGEHAIVVTGDPTQGDYKVVFVNGTLTITQAPVTVKAKNMSKTYGVDDPQEYTTTITGLKRNDDRNVITYTISRSNGENAGSYTITPTGDVGQGNYSVTYTTGTFKINKRKLSTDFVGLDKVSFKADGENHSPQVVFSKYTPVTQDTDYKVSGETTANDAGVHTITVTGIGTNFSGSIALPWYITGVGDKEVTYDGQPHTIVVGEGETGIRFKQQKSDEDYTLTAPLEYTAAGSYTIYYKTTVTNPMYGYVDNVPETLDVKGSAVLTIKKAPLTVTPDDVTKLYNAEDPALTYTVTGLINGESKEDVMSGSLSRAKGEAVGEYAITQGTLAPNDNYYIETFTTGKKLSITKIPVTADCFTVNLTSGEYNEALNANEVNYTGVEWTATANAATGITGLGTITVKYYSVGEDNSETLLTSVPVNAGKYCVKLEVEEGDNYQAVTGDAAVASDGWWFKIKSSAFPLDVMTSEANWPAVVAEDALTYTGNPITLLTAPTTPYDTTHYTIKYSLDGVTWSTDIPTGTNAGDYTVYVFYEAKDVNHVSSETKQYNVTIAKKPNEATAPTESFTITKASGTNVSDGVISGLDSAKNYEYSTDGGETWIPVETGSTTITGIKAGSVNIRYQGDVNTEPSGDVTVEVGYKLDQNAPSAEGITVTNTSGVNENDGVISGVDSTMEYSIDNGETWNEVTGTTLTGLSAGTVKLRYKGTEDKNVSDSIELTIIAKADQTAPDEDTLTVIHTSSDSSNDGVISGVNDTMEYSLDGGTTWLPIAENLTAIENLPIGDVKLRYKGTDVKNSSAAITVNVHEKETQDAPLATSFTVNKATGEDIADGSIAGFDNTKKYEYSIDDGVTWIDVADGSESITGFKPGNIKIRYKGDNNKKPSDAVTVVLGYKTGQDTPDADKITITNTSGVNENNGVISGVDSTMEYSTDNGVTWNEVTGTTITGLSAGTVKLRYKETSDKNASDSIELTIIAKADQTAPDEDTLTVIHTSSDSSNDGVISGVNDTMEYSLDGGTTWLPIAENLTAIENLPIGDVKLRYKGTDVKNSSAAITVNVHEKETQDAPLATLFTVNKATGEDIADGSISGFDSTKKYEYSIDDGVTWSEVADGSESITGLNPGNIKIRYKGDNSKKPSGAVTVVLGYKEEQAAPDADKINVTNTSGEGKTDGKITGIDDTMEYSTDGGKTWTPVEEEKTTIDDLPSGEVVIRYKETADQNPGEVLKVTVKDKTEQSAPDADKIKVSNTSGEGKTDGKITGVDDAMEYSSDGGKTWTPVEEGKTSIDDLPSGEIVIRKKGTEDSNPGEVLKVIVKDKTAQSTPDKEKISVINASSEDQTDGVIKGVDDTMEYSLDAGNNWTPVEENQTEIDNLPVGDVEIRLKGGEDKNPGESLKVSIGVTSRTQGVVNFKTDESAEPVESCVESAQSSNIEEYAQTQVEEGKDIKIELEITPRKEEDVADASVKEIAKVSSEVFSSVEAKDVETQYLEIDLAKYVDNTKEGNISDTGTPLEIELNYDSAKVGTPVVIRTHNGKAKVFERLSERVTKAFKDATYYVSGNKIYLYSQFFSDFALVYATKKTYYVSIDTGVGDPIVQVVGENSRIELPTGLTKEGYGFGGWYKDADYMSAWDADNDKVNEDTRIYGKWDKSVTDVSVTVDTVNLTKAGETSQLKVIVKPEDAANKKVTYQSSNTKVATVDDNGKITAVANGTATITVTTVDGAKTATVKVTVAIPEVKKQGTTEQPKTEATTEQNTEKSESVTAKQVEKNSLAMNAGLKISQTGSKINISWGKVKDADGYEVYVAYCGTKFNTKKPAKTIKGNETLSVTITKINGKKINLKKNYKLYIIAYKLVDGEKSIRAKSITGHIVGRKNTAYTNVKGIKLAKNNYSISVGKTAKIKAKTVLVDKSKKQLSDAHAKEFRYATSNKKIATVNKSGKIKGVKAGTCTIYVYARNGYAKKIKVTVK